jgi:hypothetical protein
MEALAALPVPLAFWTWETRYYYRSIIIWYCATFVVTGIAFFVIASVFSGATAHTHPRLVRWSRILGAMNFVIVCWFISVEWCWFMDGCPDCGHRRSVFEYQIGPFVVHRRVGQTYPSFVESVAAELGTPCSHPKTVRHVKQRWSGLCLVFESGAMWLSYNGMRPCERDVVRSWLARDPNFGQTFRQRVFERGDWTYWHSLTLQMRDACSAVGHPP